MKLKLWLLVAAAMLAVPIWMIYSHEEVRHAGEVFLFKTAPIDPRDPFRGEYVSLAFEAERGPWNCEGLAERKDEPDPELYAALDHDAYGFAVITGLSLQPPAQGPYVKVRTRGWWRRQASNEVQQVELPFDRYYLQEGQGRRTEELMMPGHRNETGTGPRESWAVVRVHNGRAVVEDLVVDGRPIKEWMEEE